MGTTTPPGTPDFPITEDAGVTDTESILTIPLTALELGAGSAFGVSSNSKNSVVVDKHNTVDGIGPSTDPIRRDFQALWVYRAPDIGTTLEWGRVPASAPGYDDTNTIVRGEIMTSTPRLPSADFPFGGHINTVRIFGNRGQFSGLESWFNYCLENYQPAVGSSYLDHALEYNQPFTPQEELYMDGNISNISVARTTYTYNYYMRQYENAITQIQEALYPDLYVFYLEKNREQTAGEGTSFLASLGTLAYEINPFTPDLLQPGYNEDFIYSDFITLDRTIPGIFINSMRGTGPAREKVGESDAAKYFDRWAFFYGVAANGVPVLNPNSAEVLDELTLRYKNIIVPRTTQKLAQESYNSYKVLFPMYTEIDYPQINSGDFITEVGEVRALNNLMRDTVSDFQQLDGAAGPFSSAQFSSNLSFVEKHQRVNQAGRRYPFIENQPVGTQRRVYDFQEWLELFGSIDPTITENANFVFLKNFNGLGIEDTPFPSDADPGLASDMEEIQTITTNLVSTYLRNYQEVLRGDRAYSEDLFYRINKYTVNERGIRGLYPIKSYFVLNTPESLARINLIDTQMRYNRTYQYEIYTCRLVVGSETRYITGRALQWNLGPPNEFAADGTPIQSTTLAGDFKPFDLFAASSTTRTDIPASSSDDSPPRDERTGTSSAPGSAAAEAARARAAARRETGTAAGAIAGTMGAGIPDDLDGGSSTLPDLDHGAGAPDIEEVMGGTTVGYNSAGSVWSPYVAQFTTETRPSIKIIELPFARPYDGDVSFGRGTMLDSPPMPPEIDVVPYRGVDYQILLLMNTGAGSEEFEPIIFNPEEQLYVLRLQEMIVDPSEKKIRYTNDDPSTQFEVYRMETKPYSYEDFKDNFRATVKTESEQNGFRPASSAALRDLIQPNKKYYYMFRALDLHGHASHPSPVYEVELINNDGAVYPSVRVIEFESIDSVKVPLKKVNRFLQITPTLAQSQLDGAALIEANDGRSLDRAPSDTNLPLGLEDEKVWGKKFKIRVTSRKTGKKLDLNITFKKKYDPFVAMEVELGGNSAAAGGAGTTTATAVTGTPTLPGY